MTLPFQPRIFVQTLVVAATLAATFPAFAAPLSKAIVLQRLSSGVTYRAMHDTLGGPQSTGFADVASQVHQTPAMWSGDFGFSDSKADMVDDRAKRPAQLTKMIALGSQGVMLTLSWHQCNPATGEPCTFKNGVQTPLTTDQWQQLLTPGSVLNQRWASQVDVLADTLKQLQSKGIAVVLRPYHESNIPGMWWSGTPLQSIALWKMLQNRLTVDAGLSNIVWVWAAAYHPKYWNTVSEYFPVGSKVDVVGVDIYPPAKDKDPEFDSAWSGLKKFAGSRPLALSEVSRLPGEAVLARHNWSFVTPWGVNMLKSANSTAEIDAFYGGQ